MTPAQYNGLIAAINVGLTPMQIGGTVTGGTATRVLYVGAGPVLAESANLTFDPTAGFIVNNTGFTITLGKVANYCAQFVDAGRIVTIGNGTYGIDVTDAIVRVNGSAGKCFAVINAAGAPALTPGVTPTSRYGGDAKICGDPDSWIIVEIGGVPYLIPAYIA